MRKFAPNFEIIMADLLKTEQQFKDVMSECRTLFEKKLHDYGASWRILRPSSLTDQLYIKAKRIRSLEIKKESPGWRRYPSGIHRPYQLWYHRTHPARKAFRG